MKQIVIGKLGTQPFKLDDPCVSSKHAVLTVKDDGSITLVDSNSTNGTYIYDGLNFVKLKPKMEYPVTEDTFIRLGPNTQFHVKKAIPPEEAYDIKHLKHIFNHYNSQKLELQAKSQSISSMRSMTIVIPVVVVSGVTLIVTQILGDEHKVLAFVSSAVVAVIALVGLLWYVSYRNKKNLIDQNKNEQYFKRNYVCPKCHISHATQPYENILAAGRCPKCKVKYFDSEQEY